MGNKDDAVPFFGKGFNKIYPLIMVVYTLLLVTNFFDRVIKYFGNWKMFRFQNEADGTDGFDPSGLIILHKERAMFEGGYKVCEHVIPLSRNLNGRRINKEHGHKDKSAAVSRANSAAELGKMVDYDNSESARTSPSGGLMSKWQSMKSGLLNIKSTLEAKNFIPLSQTQGTKVPSHASPSEFLNEIFQKLKTPSQGLKELDAGDDEF
ncbi:LMBR1-like membrane protein isoform 2 [Hibiscus syriacus]|uniref:LMBR1-like membrane protein isoform 2 n=1 Tax=Hibiscus syriacus TaxID=106335 RepID=A0A6A3AV65_HIBSY|nr:LMBR1-like membrane protein isoform 2 [Hibiscus syriacus]